MANSLTITKSQLEQDIQFEAIADSYLTDPAFVTCREDETLWGTTIADGLDKS
jgi:hypothetical protein